MSSDARPTPSIPFVTVTVMEAASRRRAGQGRAGQQAAERNSPRSKASEQRASSERATLCKATGEPSRPAARECCWLWIRSMYPVDRSQLSILQVTALERTYIWRDARSSIYRITSLPSSPLLPVGKIYSRIFDRPYIGPHHSPRPPAAYTRERGKRGL
jgi:hypothetical protein